MDKMTRYWLALCRLKSIEKADLKALLNELGSPEAVFRQRGAHLSAFSEVLAKSVSEFESNGAENWKRVDEELELAQKAGVRIVAFDDEEYPHPLKEISDPPPVVYAKGEFYDYKRPAVAIVGTRRPTHYGLRVSEVISRDLAAMGAIVVSGMARGCDMAAHRGALSAGGFTVAVLGTGVDVPYPKENKKLYEEIAAKGLILSELPMGTRPAPHNFPKRNRIIAGLCLGVLVAEAPLKSGALQTARLALDYNREAFAVPGPVTSKASEGANRLLKDGAGFVENAVDVMEGLSLSYTAPEKKESPRFEGEELAVWKALGEEPVHIDSIAEMTGLNVSRASSVLLGMEIKGFISQKPGKLFVKRV